MKLIKHNSDNKPWDLNNKDTWDEEWERRNESKGRWPLNRPQIYKEIIPQIRDNSTILDIGCGDGSFFYYILEKYKNVKLYGVDISNWSIEFIKEKFGDSVNLKIIKNLSDIDFNINFDIITMIEIIEHINDPINFLIQSFRFLKPHGKILISTPNENFTYDRCHLYSFEESDFIDILGKFFGTYQIKTIDLPIREKSIIIAIGDDYKGESK